MFSSLKRLILWVVRVACAILLIVGIAMAAMEEKMRVAGIILAVVSLIVGIASARISDKVTSKQKKKKVSVCKHCKQPMRGAQCTYEYDLSKVWNDHVTLPVDITVTCPNCGKETYLPEYVYLSTYTTGSPNKIQKEAEKEINKLINELFSA